MSTAICRRGETARQARKWQSLKQQQQKTGAEYLAEAVTGRNAAPKQTQQNIDNNSDTGYDNINNMRGDINAQRGDRLHSAAGNGVRADSGPVDTEPQRTDRNDGRGNLQVSGIVLLSGHAKSTLKGRGVVVEEAYDASGNKAAFCSALDAARNSDSDNGWAVTPKTVESLDENGAKPFMTENGTAGYALLISRRKDVTERQRAEAEPILFVPLAFFRV